MGRSLFPFPELRKGQDAMLDDCRTAFAAGEHLLVHAPTGLGKTAAALTAAIEVARERGLLVVALTSRQTQHAIFVETLKRIHERHPLKIVDVISKQDMCPRDDLDESRYGVFQAVCTALVRNNDCRYHAGYSPEFLPQVFDSPLSAASLKALCHEEVQCPHRVALEAAQECDVLVCDYNYLFTPWSDVVWDRIQRPLEEVLLIVDEAHNLPDRIRLSASPTLSLQRIREAQREAGQALRAQLSILERLVESLTEHEGEKEIDGGSVSRMLDAALKQKLTDLEGFVRLLERSAQRRLQHGKVARMGDVADFLHHWRFLKEGSDLRLAHGGDKPWQRKLSLRLLDPASISAPVFHAVHGSVLMSGTLKPHGFYRDLLGLDAERSRKATYSSPFPPENRLLLCVDDVSTLYRNRGDPLYRKLAASLTAVAQATPGNVAAFFPSYALRDDVASRLGDHGKTLLLEERGASPAKRTALLDRLQQRDALLLAVMGGIFGEGVDYPGNLLAVVAVVGIPVPPPSLEQKKLEEYFERKFGDGKGRLYAQTYPAVNRVLQAAGRCIRSETDRGVVLLYDNRLGHRPYRRFLPKEVRHCTSSAVPALVRGFNGPRTGNPPS